MQFGCDLIVFVVKNSISCLSILSFGLLYRRIYGFHIPV